MVVGDGDIFSGDGKNSDGDGVGMGTGTKYFTVSTSTLYADQIASGQPYLKTLR